MSLDLCLKQLHVVHIKVFHRMQYYAFALVLLRHFPVSHFPVRHFPVRHVPVRHFPVLQIPVTLPVVLFLKCVSTPVPFPCSISICASGQVLLIISYSLWPSYIYS